MQIKARVFLDGKQIEPSEVERLIIKNSTVDRIVKSANQRLSDEEKAKIYAALKLIENLHKQGLVKRHIFKNILNDYKDCVDLSEFKCYT